MSESKSLFDARDDSIPTPLDSCLRKRGGTYRRCPHCSMGIQRLDGRGPFTWRACSLCGVRSAYEPIDRFRDVFGNLLAPAPRIGLMRFARTV